jgi:hypothetical protein
MWVVSVYCSERRESFLWREDTEVVRVFVGEWLILEFRLLVKSIGSTGDSEPERFLDVWWATTVSDLLELVWLGPVLPGPLCLNFRPRFSLLLPLPLPLPLLVSISLRCQLLLA